MRIGLFTAAQWSPQEDPARVWADLRQQVEAARDNGFSSLLLGQHLLTAPMGMFQMTPLLARLSAITGDMQIGPGVLLLSMMNPVLAAEEAATIDWLSDGRYVMAAGLGYRPQEFQAMGVDMGTRVGRLTEGVELIKRLWTEERVTHEGRYFQVTDAGAGIRPKQAPRPPVWLGGDVEAAVRRAARIADAWLGSPTADLATLAGHVAAFADERRKHGLPDDVACPMVRECFLGRDAGHARAVSRGPLLYKYSAYASWGHEDAAGEDFEAGFDDFAADRFIVGDAEKVRDDIQRLAEITGTDHIVARVQWPGLEQAEVIANIERLGRLVANLP